jgi:hypothetical protein
MARIFDDDPSTVEASPSVRSAPPAVERRPDGLSPDDVATAKRLADATVLRATTGKLADGLSPAERVLVNDAAFGLSEARDMGKAKDPGAYWDRVRTRGKWDFKTDAGNRYTAVNQKARQYFGNWFFGASGAAWQHGAVGRLGAMTSDWSNIGENVLRRGAGAYQIYSDVQDLRHPWKLLKLRKLRDTLGRQDGSNFFGDNPGDGDEISEGYAAYNKAHNIRLNIPSF